MQSLGFFGALTVLIISGVLNGSSVTPVKYAKRSAWENLWIIQSLVAMLFLPWLLVWATIPKPFEVYQVSGFWPVAKVAAFGLGWGIGNLLYIIGIVMVGMSVSFAIILSLTATLGSLLPLIALHPEQLGSRQGRLLLTALAVTVLGILLCAFAGAGRIDESQGPEQGKAKRHFWLGVFVCVLSGIFSPMLNFAFAFGDSISKAAEQAGASRLWAPNALWAIVFTAAFGVNAAYPLKRLGFAGSWRRFLEAPWENILAGSLMGVLLLASIITYGIGADGLGLWGPSVGFAVNMCATILVANVWGLATGEWKNASRKSYLLLTLGLMAITCAVVMVSKTS